jgi:hypothetical protein
LCICEYSCFAQPGTGGASYGNMTDQTRTSADLKKWLLIPYTHSLFLVLSQFTSITATGLYFLCDNITEVGIGAIIDTMVCSEAWERPF